MRYTNNEYLKHLDEALTNVQRKRAHAVRTGRNRDAAELAFQERYLRRQIHAELVPADTKEQS